MKILSPKESGKLIAELARNVTIPDEGVKKLARVIYDGLKSKQISIDGFSQHELHPQKADEAAVDWIFLIDTLNFSFWSPSEETSSKWQVSFNGKKYTGYFALCAAINRAIKEGIPVTSPHYFSKVTKTELDNIFRSDTNTPAPMIDNRLSSLHEVGEVLLNKYQGTFVNCIKEANQSAQKLLEIVVNEFPCYRDESEYQGHKVSFYKRAQILIGDIWACFRGQGLGYFEDIDSIVMFADYRIPQSLIHFGAMKYSDELLLKLKSDTPLENGSPDEVEIRGCSIHAVELVRDEVKRLLEQDGDKESTVNSILIDHFLWDYRRQHAKELEVIPFHKTRCIYY